MCFQIQVLSLRCSHEITTILRPCVIGPCASPSPGRSYEVGLCERCEPKRQWWNSGWFAKGKTLVKESRKKGNPKRPVIWWRWRGEVLFGQALWWIIGHRNNTNYEVRIINHNIVQWLEPKVSDKVCFPFHDHILHKWNMYLQILFDTVYHSRRLQHTIHNLASSIMLSASSYHSCVRCRKEIRTDSQPRKLRNL